MQFSDQIVSLQFRCRRVKVTGRNVRSKINRMVDENLKEKAYTFHCLVQRGRWWSPELWLVASKSRGVPFAELLLAKYKTRPLLGFAKSSSTDGDRLHIMLCTVNDKGSETIEEFDYKLDEVDSNERKLIEAFANEVLSKNGKVVGVPDGFDEGWRFVRNSDGQFELTTEKAEAERKVEWLRSVANSQKLTTEKGRITKVPTTPATKAGLAFGGAVMFALLFTRSEQQAVEKVVKEEEAARSALVKEFEDGYAPRAAMYQLYRTMVKKVGERRDTGLRDSVAGWKPQKIDVTPSRIMVNMTSDRNASVGNLRSTVERLGAGMISIGENEVVVVREFDPACHVPVLGRAALIPIEGTIQYTLAGLKRFFPGASLKFGNEVKTKNYATRAVTVTIKDMSEESLDLLGVLLNDQPIAFQKASLRVDGALGLLSGSVELKVIGCAMEQINEAGLCK
ncbi:hypothetical protein AB9X29_003763 [Vibrio vulnificus]